MDLKVLEEKYGSYIIEMRRWFHENPEVSMKEFKTAEKIRSELGKMGLVWRPCGNVTTTGTVAEIRGGRPGKTILLRADIDALSVTEATGLPFASRNKGVMHACGHDCHIAALLTAARMLCDIKNEIPGTVRLVFQPGEETARGAVSLIEDGLLDGVDAAFGQHIWSETPAGKASLLQAGGRMAATDQFKITVTGVSGHAALPHNCADATVAMAEIIVNLQTIASRECDPLSPLVVTVGTASSGSRWNVISGEAVIEGTVRTLDNKTRDMAEAAIKRIASKTAESCRCTAEVVYDRLCDVVNNDPDMVAIARAAAKKVLGEDGIFEDRPAMGGEDFGFVTSRVKSAFAFLGTRNPACSAVYPQHSDHYTVDESVLIKGALLHVCVAMDFLQDDGA